jgi:hypothetical protein
MQKSGIVRTLLGALGVVLVLVGLPLAVAIGVSLAGSSTVPFATRVAGFVFFAGLTLTGAYLARRNLSRIQHAALSEFEQEQALLGLARANGGRVTLAEVASGCKLTVAESKATLERLTVQGVADVVVTDDGSVAYDFKGLNKRPLLTS